MTSTRPSLSASAMPPAPGWSVSSWRERPARHQPQWPDPAALEQACKQLGDHPPLVFAGEARSLMAHLGRVCAGEAFLLQAGDCAESFDSSADSIRDKLRVILQMAIVLTYSGGMPVVKVGRIAGQFAKPRSSPTEKVGDTELTSFLGHMVNDIGFSESERLPDPRRLLTSYQRAASTLNLLRAFTRGGFADLSRVASWNREFVADNRPTGAGRESDISRHYAALAQDIDRALRFIAACGITSDNTPQLHEVEFYTSHEALVLDYEEALTREDSLNPGHWYGCSAHMLWIGERTRQLDGAHVEFLRGVNNPLACKVGPTATPEEVIGLCEALNPHRVPGRLTLITRVGASGVRDLLPPLVRGVRDSGHPVVWVCDPMHGNTYTSESGRKTRHFDDVLSEIAGFFEVHERCETIPGGIHIELTGDDVTECLGGAAGISDSDLGRAFETLCDPRLNGRQSVDLAFRVAKLLAERS